MKHLKKFNENADETLEPQDLLDFTQDIVDDGYEVTFITNSAKGAPFTQLIPSDIISNNDVSASFDIYYRDSFDVVISGFPNTGNSPLNLEVLQKVLDTMDVAKKRIDDYDFVLDIFKINAGLSEDASRNPIIKNIVFSFVLDY